MSSKLFIGISACMFHPDPERATFAPKTLLYYEQSMPHWVLANGAYPVLVPSKSEYASVQEIVSELDGLLLHGGADLAPETYNEVPIDKNRWPGDALRDKYEIELYQEFKKQNKPVLGICRGNQVINAAEGGTLIQDIKTHNPDAFLHRDPVVYDNVFHEIEFCEGSVVQQIYNCEHKVITNSVHHQAIDKVAPQFVVEARCPIDGIIEGIRHKDTRLDDAQSPFILGVQWHPEFMMKTQPEHLQPNPLMKQFLQEVALRK